MFADVRLTNSHGRPVLDGKSGATLYLPREAETALCFMPREAENRPHVPTKRDRWSIGREESMKTSRPRRVIRGYRASKQFTGYGETRTREMVADGTHPRAMKGGRATSFFDDEPPVGSASAPTEVAQPHLRVPPKSACGTTGHGDAPVYRCSRRGVVVMENEKRAFSIAAFCENYGIGRTSAYEEIAAGRLQVVKAGKRTLVPADAAESWLRNLPPARVKEARS
jgi:predicted DNA-binding transcriptional regulator AlpA